MYMTISRFDKRVRSEPDRNNQAQTQIKTHSRAHTEGSAINDVMETEKFIFGKSFFYENHVEGISVYYFWFLCILIGFLSLCSLSISTTPPPTIFLSHAK